MNYLTDMYCDKCGKIWKMQLTDNKKCAICKNTLKVVPDDYFDNYEGIFYISEEMEQKLINDLVLTSPNFDQYYFDHKEDIKGEQDREYYAKMARAKSILEEQSRRVTCTYCGSANVRKIGLLNRAVSTELWGLGSKKIGKQFHCNNCKADF